MKKTRNIFTVFTALLTMFTFLSAFSVSAEYTENSIIVDKGTVQIRKGGFKHIPETYDEILLSIEDDSIVSMSPSPTGVGGYYAYVGLENGITKLSDGPYWTSYGDGTEGWVTYVWTLEVSDQFSADLQLSHSEYTLPLDTKEKNIINIVDPYDDSWYNSFKGESIYNDNAKWISDNESVVIVRYGQLFPQSVGTATVTATLDGVTYECLVTVTEAEPIKGDANMDGTVDLYDVIAIAKHIMEVEILSDVELTEADYNGDGKADLHDAIEIAKALLP